MKTSKLPYFGYQQDDSNILRDDSGHLKVADFGVSKLLKVSKGLDEDRPLSYEDNPCKCCAV